MTTDIDYTPKITTSDTSVDETGGLDSVIGTLTVNYGGDSAGTVSLSASGATWDADTHTLAAGDGTWKVVVNDDSTYTFTQLAAMDHPTATSPDSNESIPITFTATDGDGDTDTVTLSFTVSDNEPPTVDIVSQDYDVDESGLDDGTTPDAALLTATGTLPINAGTTDAYTLSVNGNEIPVDGTTINGDYETLEINAAGEWTYTLNDNYLEHVAGDPNDSVPVENFAISVADDSGTSDPAETTLTINILDDGPVFTTDLAAEDVAMMTDETDQLNVAVTSEDPVISWEADAGADGGSAVVSLVITAQDGATDLMTTAGKHAITLVADSATQVSGMYDSDNSGSPDATAFTVSIDEEGHVTVTQKVALYHPDPATLAGETPDTSSYDEAVTREGLISAQVTVTDGDLDVVKQSVGIGAMISFEDDGPVINSVMDAIVASEPSITFTGLYDADFGADGLDFLSVALGSGGSFGGKLVSFVQGLPDDNNVTRVDVTDSDAKVLFTFYFTAETQPVSGGGDGNVEFVAFTNLANPDESPFFNLTVNPDGTYNFTLESNEVLSVTTATGGDFHAFGPTGNVATADQSLIISGSDVINASDNGIGVFNPQINDGEQMLLTFANEQTNNISFTLQQWGGSGDTASVR